MNVILRGEIRILFFAVAFYSRGGFRGVGCCSADNDDAAAAAVATDVLRTWLQTSALKAEHVEEACRQLIMSVARYLPQEKSTCWSQQNKASSHSL